MLVRYNTSAAWRSLLGSSLPGYFPRCPTLIIVLPHRSSRPPTINMVAEGSVYHVATVLATMLLAWPGTVSQGAEPSITPPLSVTCELGVRHSSRNGGDLHPYTTGSEHYSLGEVDVPGLGSLMFAVILHSDRTTACCHRVQMFFNKTLILDQSPGRAIFEWSFIPLTEWTACVPDIRQLTCRGTWKGGEALLRSLFPPDTWSLILQQCLTPEDQNADFGVKAYNEDVPPSDSFHYPSLTQTALINPVAATLTHRTTLSVKETSPDRPLRCRIRGRLNQDRAWHIFPQVVSVHTGTFFSFSFGFVSEVPLNDELVVLHFLPEDDLSQLPTIIRCEGNAANGSSIYRPDDSRASIYRADVNAQTTDSNGRGHSVSLAEQTTASWDRLGLSLKNTWSGCKIMNDDGYPTYYCDGGRNFLAPLRTRIVVSKCRDSGMGLTLNYSMEFYNVRSDGCTRSGAISIKKSQTLHYFVPQVFTAAVFIIFSRV